MTRAPLAVLVAAMLAPLVTWLPMLAIRWPALGLPPYEPAMGIDAWQAQVWWLGILGAIAWAAWAHDRWLAVTIGLVALGLCWRGLRLDPTHAILFGGGAGALLLLREMPVAWGPWLVRGCALAGAFQAVYMLQQWCGYDLLWSPLVAGPAVQMIAVPQMYGTLGTVGASSAYVAIAAPLLPWWLLPLPIAAVWLSDSRAAMLALAIGLCVRYRRVPGRCALAIAGGTVAAGALYYTYGAPAFLKGTTWTRLELWRFGLGAWWREAKWLGWGLGGWAAHVPLLQAQQGFAPAGVRELFREAHNEYIQWLAELGLIGTACLLAWVWVWRRGFLDDVWGGALAAVAINALGFFTFHVPALALLALVVTAAATRAKES